MHCTLPCKSLPLRQGGHHLEAVTQYFHAVGPVGIVLVELSAVGALRQAVEVGETG